MERFSNKTPKQSATRTGMNSRLPAILTVTLAVVACLSACRTAAPDAPVLATSAENTPEALQPAAEAMQPNQVRQADANGMEVACAGTSFTITSTSAAGAGKQTALHRVAPDGTPHRIAEPREMTGYTAVGLGCVVVTSTGNPYFVVQYGELPYGCSFCEWFYLYDAKGGQLTKSDPTILVDRSLREAERQNANNLEYESMMRKLGITHPEMRYFETNDEKRRL